MPEVLARRRFVEPAGLERPDAALGGEEVRNLAGELRERFLRPSRRNGRLQMTDANVVGCSHDAELDAPRLFAADQMRGHDISGASVALAREVGSGSIALRAAGEDETRARLHDPRNER